MPHDTRAAHPLRVQFKTVHMRDLKSRRSPARVRNQNSRRGPCRNGNRRDHQIPHARPSISTCCTNCSALKPAKPELNADTTHGRPRSGATRPTFRVSASAVAAPARVQRIPGGCGSKIIAVVGNAVRRPAPRVAQARPDAQVHPVEIADGGRTAAQGWNQIVQSTNELHAAMNACRKGAIIKHGPGLSFLGFRYGCRHIRSLPQLMQILTEQLQRAEVSRTSHSDPHAQMQQPLAAAAPDPRVRSHSRR